jgi:hypothetical protein
MYSACNEFVSARLRRSVPEVDGGYQVDMKSLIIAATQRLSGDRPAALRALAGATVAGTTTGVVVYKLLRQ